MTKINSLTIFFIIGALSVLAFAPFDFWFVIFISAGALIACINLFNQIKIALYHTLAFSIGFFSFGMSWIAQSMMHFGNVPEILSYFAVFILALYLSIYNLIFVFVTKKFELKSPFALASIFVISEFLRANLFTGLPWLSFGYSLIDTPLSSFAPVSGVFGLSFVIMLISAFLYNLLSLKLPLHGIKNIKHSILGLFTTIIIAIILNFVNWVKIDPRHKDLKVSLIQANISQEQKWNIKEINNILKTYDDLIKQNIKSDLIILPEGALPVLETDLQSVLKNWQNLALKNNSQIIIGSLFDKNTEIFNSAIVLGNKNDLYNLDTINRYNKHHLVPFGEYLPLENIFNKFREIFILPTNLSAGNLEAFPLKAVDKKFNMAICYEIIFNDEIQKRQKLYNSDFLLTITNDAWFGNSIGPKQHFQIARMRALELGRILIRVASTGITALVDEKGQVIKQIPQFTKQSLNGLIPVFTGTTPFTFFGNTLIMLLSCVIVIFSILRAKIYKRKCKN